MKSTFSIAFFLKKSTVYKDLTSPIMGRIRVSGSVSDFCTKLQILPANWNPQKGRGKGSAPETANLNTALSVIEKIIHDIKNSLLIEKGYLNAGEIKTEFLRLAQTAEEREQEKAALLEKQRQEREEQERGISLITYFDEYIHSRKDEVTAGELTNKTYSRYGSIRNRLITYMQTKYNLSDLPLKKIDIHFIKNFEMYLRTNFISGNNTVMKNIQKLSTVVTLAHDTGLIPTNPFRLYNFRYEETERDILTHEELTYLYNYKFASKKLERIRDNYIFSCYTGLAYTDTDHLTTQNFKKHFDGNEWIIKRREKTNVESKVLLLDIPRQILKKYEGQLPEGQLLPIISNQKTNEYLKEIAEITGIEKHLTYHLASHNKSYNKLRMNELQN